MSKRNSNRKEGNPPVEIPMTDLGWSEDGEEKEVGEEYVDIHAAGTPGGGTASGGLAI